MDILAILIKIVLLFLLVRGIITAWYSSAHIWAFLGNSLILVLIFGLLAAALVIGIFVWLNRRNSLYDSLENPPASLADFKEKNKTEEF